MFESLPYQWFADAVLVVHFAVVVFVIGGLAAVIAGNLRHWRWVNRPGFRVAHLAAIGFVVLQAWLGAVCPLTWLESWLRVQAGQGAYSASFIEYWIQKILFYEAPTWVFVAVYSAFLLVVIASWIRFPPSFGRRGD